MSLRTVILGGATGYVGRYLEGALILKGYKVTRVVRKSKKDTDITWDDVKSNGLPNDTYAAINVAGQKLWELRWTQSLKDRIVASRVDTTKTLADAAKNTKANVFMSISGVSYYRPDVSKIYTEDDTCEPYDFFSTLCHDWEAAGNIERNSNIRRIVIRSGVVLGSGSAFDQTTRLPTLLVGGSIFGSGQQIVPWIHINDLTNMFIHALENKELSGVLNGVAPQIVTNAKLTEEYARALGKKVRISFPEGILKQFFHPERAVMVLEGAQILPQRVLKAGFKYEYPDIRSACESIKKS